MTGLPYPPLLPGLYHPGLQQLHHLLNQSAAAQAAQAAAQAAAAANPAPTPGAFNPSMFAQLAMAAQHNPLLASAYAQLNSGGLMASVAADRLRQQRFSPYSSTSPSSPTLGANTTAVGATSPTISAGSSGGSAFDSVVPKAVGNNTSSSSALSPGSTVSPPSSPKSGGTAGKVAKPSELLSIEKMVNGLDGSGKNGMAAATVD